MARLCENGSATFVILDREPLYDQDDIARISADHGIAPDLRNGLWRRLEQAGRAYLDQKRLSRAARLVGVRQDLQLARRLAAQLAELTPQPGQTAADAASIALSRLHLAALREGERRTDAEGGSTADLDDVSAVLTWLTGVYDAALSACQDELNPEETWRRSLTDFYTRTLARPWTAPSGDHGERFLADCRAVIEAADDGV
jgi:hypothetical protein